MKTIKVTAESIPEDEGGFTVCCPERDIYTQGGMEEECVASLRGAAELDLEELSEKVPLREIVPRHIGLTIGVR